MRVVVTGAGGLLGTTLVPLWRRAGAEVVAWTRADLDVTDETAVVGAIRDARPELVVHAAAYTAVDRAETEPAQAMLVNGQGTANVCRAAAAASARLCYVSTDYVFSGQESGPIAPDASPAPLGAYGRSKLEGERAVLALGGSGMVVRTGWLYGPGGENFVDTMRAAAGERRAVSVVDDQFGAPTSTGLVGEGLWGLCRRAIGGVWHLMASGRASWLEVARTVYTAAGAPEELVTPCSSAASGRPAPRPRNSVLDCRATETALGVSLPGWRESVRCYAGTGTMKGIGLVSGGGT